MAQKQFPTFSIITVTLNHLSGLKATAKSLQAQNFNDYEWIVVDGESSDNTLAFLREKRSAERRTQYPFQFISEKDDGIYDAMNKGITKSRGKYLLFLNAGDVLANNTVLNQVSNATKEKPDFIYGDALEPLGKKKPSYKTARTHEKIEWGMFTHHQSMFYRRTKLRDNKIHYSQLYKIASDYDFTARFLKIASTKHYVPKPICIFEQGGVSQTSALIGRREQFMIRERLEIAPPMMNMYVFLIQSIAWALNKACPSLYKMVRKQKH